MPQIPHMTYLKPEQQKMIVALAELGGTHKTSREICEKAGLSKRSGGARLDALSLKGLVSSTYDHGARAYLWSLTHAGREQSGVHRVTEAMIDRALEVYWNRNAGARDVIHDSEHRGSMKRALEAVLS